MDINSKQTEHEWGQNRKTKCYCQRVYCREPYKIKHMDWKKYENVVLMKYQEYIKKAMWQKNLKIKGKISNRLRQIDIFVENCTIDGKVCSLMIDAKHYNRRIDIKLVESMIGMLEDVGVEKGLIIAEKGYTKGAINRIYNAPCALDLDILTIAELSRFQSTVAIPYSGNCAVILTSPFGWIIDGTRNDVTVATLYRRGNNLSAEADSKKEFMYINFIVKDRELNTLEKAIEFIKEDFDGLNVISSKLEYLSINNKDVAILTQEIEFYPTKEIVGFIDEENFILFCTLLCPDKFIVRDIRKLKYVLENAIPLTKINSNLPQK